MTFDQCLIYQKKVTCICAGNIENLPPECGSNCLFFNLCFICAVKLITCFTDEKWKLASFNKEYIYFDLKVCFWYQLINLEPKFCMHVCRYVVKNYLHRIKQACRWLIEHYLWYPTVILVLELCATFYKWSVHLQKPTSAILGLNWIHRPAKVAFIGFCEIA